MRPHANDDDEEERRIVSFLKVGTRREKLEAGRTYETTPGDDRAIAIAKSKSRRKLSIRVRVLACVRFFYFLLVT